MQALLDAVRDTGAKNVVIAGGLDWAYDMSGFLEGQAACRPQGQRRDLCQSRLSVQGRHGGALDRQDGSRDREVLPVIVSEFGSESRGGPRPGGEQWVRQVLAGSGGSRVELDGLGPAPRRRPAPDLRLEVHAHAELRQVGQAGPRGHAAPVHAARCDSTTLAKAGATPPRGDPAPVGIFEDHEDVGEVLHAGPGQRSTPASRGVHRLPAAARTCGSPAMRSISPGSRPRETLALTADVAFLGSGTDPHRKACLMIRQSLDADSAYVDVALHGDGLTSLQFREAKGAATHEVQANVSAPRRLRIEKRGKYALMFLASEGERAELLRRGGADRASRSRSTSASACVRTTRT